MNNYIETADWLEALYGRCSNGDGTIIYWSKRKGERPLRFPIGDGGNLIQAAKAIAKQAADRKDHYIKINLLDAGAIDRRAKKQGKNAGYLVGGAAEVKTVVSFHLDCDAGKSDKYLDRSEMLDCLNAMPVPPSLIVNSDGDEGGFHVYWLLANPYRIESDSDRAYISGLANRWQSKLNGITSGKLDATADICRVLRVVGQRRANGNLVSAHEYHRDRLYSLRDLTIPVEQTEIKTKARRRAERLADEILGPITDPGDLPIQAYIDGCGLTVEQLFAAEGWTDLGRGDWVRPDSESGSRTAAIGTELDRPGANFFSGNETRFPCQKRDGGVGRFHSIDAIFVGMRFDGDWKAAAAWCREQISERLNHRVNLEGFSPQARKVSA